MNFTPSRLIAACVLSSFLGGALTSLMCQWPSLARAEDPVPKKVLRAERFVIVDKDDVEIGYLGYGPKGGEEEFGLFFQGARVDTMHLSRSGLTFIRQDTGQRVGLEARRLELGAIQEEGKKDPPYGIRITNGARVWRQP